jgi:hypothetical protein
MTNWTLKRKISFAVHTAVVSIPFGFSTVSALIFWYTLFASWWLAAPMVVVIDVLALLGLVLYIARIASPFVWLRHLLPFISIVPLGLELYALLEHNGALVAGIVTLIVASIMVAIAWKCFTTLERLFIDPIEAARERAREQVSTFVVELAKLEEMNTIVDTFAVERMRYHAPVVTEAHVAYAASKRDAPHAQLESINADTQSCPKCGTFIESRSAWLAARRWKQCANCKEN